MDDTEQPVGWVLLTTFGGRSYIMGRNNSFRDGALRKPFRTEADAREYMIPDIDRVLTLQEARAWLTLQSL